MKKLLFTSIFSLVIISGLFAQQSNNAEQANQWGSELKLNPVAAIFEVFIAEVEFVNTNKNIGFALEGIAGDGLWAFFAHGKYYFKDEPGCTGFYGGVFVFGINEGIGGGLGFEVGYKLYSSKRVLFDVAGGVGRSFEDGDPIPYGKFSVGYRF